MNAASDGLTLLSISSTSVIAARRACTRSIHCPERSASAVRFVGEVIALVSKRPIWLVDAACSVTARPPTIHRIAGSRPRRSASFTSRSRRGARTPTDEAGDEAVAPVPPGAGVGEHLASHRREAEHVVEFPEREQAGVGGDGGAVKFELQPAVEGDPQPRPRCFTRRLLHPPPPP